MKCQMLEMPKSSHRYMKYKSIFCQHVFFYYYNSFFMFITFYFKLLLAHRNGRTEILNIVPEWPGCEHDSRIFQNSRIYMRYRQHELDGMLVGDVGYPALSFLLTPVNNPMIDEEIRFDICCF